MPPAAGLPNVQEQGGISDSMPLAKSHVYRSRNPIKLQVFAACRSLRVSVNHLGARGTPSCDRSPNLSQTRVTLLDFILRLTPDRRLASEPTALMIYAAYKDVETAWLRIPVRPTQ